MKGFHPTLLATAAAFSMNLQAAQGAVAPEAGATTTAWVRVAMENDSFTASGPVRFGLGATWTPSRQVNGAAVCAPTSFGLERSGWNQGRTCEVQKTVPAVVQLPQPAMPVVNRALIPPPATTYSEARTRKLTADELKPGSPWVAVAADIGAFREPCGSFSHFSNDDPIVFPNQPGLSHLHTFVGNSAADARSTGDKLLTSGGSTCAGGTLNRTAYWMPSMIDARTGQPIPPASTNFYYKLGYFGVKAGTVQPFPKGLRMIAGNAAATRAVGWPARFACLKGGDGNWHAEIPACAAGGDLEVSVTFPQCWDGKNLDSPDHKSHMAYGVPGKGCPVDHPVALPEVTQNVHYAPGNPTGTADWRLSSDAYVGPGGYSLHADWFGAWDADIQARFVTHCINHAQDCHDMILGDNSIVY